MAIIVKLYRMSSHTSRPACTGGLSGPCPSDLPIPSLSVRKLVPCPATPFRPDYVKVSWSCATIVYALKDSCILECLGQSVNEAGSGASPVPPPLPRTLRLPRPCAARVSFSSGSSVPFTLIVFRAFHFASHDFAPSESVRPRSAPRGIPGSPARCAPPGPFCAALCCYISYFGVYNILIFCNLYGLRKVFNVYKSKI